ncbi:urease accessory protein UreD [Puniceibacterium sp. IMCC21224]|uniref:urease accessory protein UreD n=1 Tax=Puniceibacterium sp. IMCC21224 TaxID=1618204 RepID=UPI001E38B334|nr:urease accessory protein UreD [Puniceibacterium sp. IMCC21224]
MLADLRQSGSAKLLFPRPSGAALPVIWLNTSGGVTGGDIFDARFEAEAGAVLSLSSQAAERIYRAMPGAPGRIDTTLTAGPGARIDWLPQETILFDSAALDRRLRINMAADASVLACETLIFGREAMGENVTDLRLRDRIDVYTDGALSFADRLRIDGDAAAHLTRGFVADGARACASVVWAAPGAARQISAVRKLLPPNAGASAITDDLLFMRVLAPDSYLLRRSLVPLLRLLSGADLPRSWNL